MSDFSQSQSRSASPPPAPPAPAANISSRPRKAQNAQQPTTSNWLSATNGITPFAQQQYVPPQEKAVGMETEKGKSRMPMFQEYMRAYQNGELARERNGAQAQGEREVNEASSNGAPAQEQQQQYLLPQQQPQHPLDPLHPSHPHQAPLDLTPEAAAYRTFLTGAQHRRLQRHDLVVRDGIWGESITRARTRLAAVNEEKATLEAKLVAMERERELYKVRNAVEISVVNDKREERRWEEWLRMQRGMEVWPVAAGLGVGRGGKGEEEEEMGGVDI